MRDGFFEIFLGESPLWFPGVAKEIVSPFEFGGKYSTSKYLGMLEGESLIVKGGYISLALEFFDGDIPGILSCKNQIFLKKEEFSCKDHLLLLNAIELIEGVESLGESVEALVKSMHIISVAEPEHDVSFSDPGLPFSIFFNISEGRFAAARIAEAIIHEAMHLQLSLIERNFEFYVDGGVNFYSPWKNSLRPISGVLHGLYVFRVISQWLEIIADASDEINIYSKKRRVEINNEISSLSLSGIERFLTKSGSLFLKRIS